MDKEHPKISMRRQSELLGVARSTAAYNPVAEDPEEIRIKRLLDEIYLIDPCLGSRRLVTVLARAQIAHCVLPGNHDERRAMVLRWLRADDAGRFAAERAALELALRQTGDARALLHQQISAQEALLAAIPAGMAVFDAHDALVSWNPEFALLADITADRMRVGSAFSDLLCRADDRLASAGQVELRRAGFADGRTVILLVPLSPRLAARPQPASDILPVPALAEPIVRVLGPEHRRARRMAS